MPGGDKTGPEGEGPMTGRKLGRCTGNDQAGSQNPEGRGMASGRRLGRRGGNRNFQNSSGDDRPRRWWRKHRRNK